MNPLCTRGFNSQKKGPAEMTALSFWCRLPFYNGPATNEGIEDNLFHPASTPAPADGTDAEIRGSQHGQRHSLESGDLSHLLPALRVLPSRRRDRFLPHGVPRGSTARCAHQGTGPVAPHASLGRRERFRRVPKRAGPFAGRN